jgi:hydrogenase maturation protein HypF
MSEMALQASQLMRERFGINEVVLSGGVWQNQVLLDLARTALTNDGFIVFTHQQTPANDGGLALGQAAVASFKIR